MNLRASAHTKWRQSLKLKPVDLVVVALRRDVYDIVMACFNEKLPDMERAHKSYLCPREYCNNNAE